MTDAFVDPNYMQPPMKRKFKPFFARFVEEVLDVMEEGKEQHVTMRERIGDKGMKRIAEALGENYTLRSLTAAKSGITYRSMPSLANALSVNLSLTTLNLGFNFEIFDIGAIAIGQALTKNTVLTELNLESNEIGDEGAIALADSLESNSSLTCLILRDNRIGHDGCTSFARILETNSTLTQLDFTNNQLDDASACALADAIMKNDGLTDLRLGFNHITESGADALAKVLPHNFSIIYLSVKNAYGDKFAPFLDRNRSRMLDSYLDALSNNRKGSWNRSKLMVIGEGRAGKTATVHSLMGMPFDADWRSTVGVSILQAETNRLVKSGHVSLLILRSNSSAWLKNDGDLSNATYTALHAARVGFENLRKRKQTKTEKALARSRSRSSMDLAKRNIDVTAEQLSLPFTSGNLSSNSFGTKGQKKESSGTEKRQPSVSEKSASIPPSSRRKKRIRRTRVEEESMKELGKQLLIHAKNMKDSVTLSVWDYGGQSVFYTLHHLFMTKFGSYLLVFDMTLFLKGSFDNSVEYILFWLSSTRIHAPGAPILLVGTFLDSIHENVPKKLKKIDDILQNITQHKFNLTRNVAKNLCYFPVSNKDRSGISELRREIAEVTRKQDYVNFQVPLSWMKCLDEITIYKKEVEKAWLKLSEIKVICSKHGVSSADQLEEMLSLFHELGVILYFKSSEALREIVTLDPQWLVDGISKIIRDNKLHKYDAKVLKENGLLKEATDLFNKGLVTIDLLEYFWGKEQLHFLLDLMQHLLLLSSWNYGTQNTYLVPSMVKKSSRKIKKEGIRCELDFSEIFLPEGVYERLICLFLQNSRGDEAHTPLVAKNMSKLPLEDEVVVFLEKVSQTIVLWVSSKTSASHCLAIILAMVRKLKEDIFSNGLKYVIRLENNDGAFVDYLYAKQHRIDPWFTGEVKGNKSLSQLKGSINFQTFLEE